MESLVQDLDAALDGIKAENDSARVTTCRLNWTPRWT
jgi:hypothetical protein